MFDKCVKKGRGDSKQQGVAVHVKNRGEGIARKLPANIPVVKKTQDLVDEVLAGLSSLAG